MSLTYFGSPVSEPGVIDASSSGAGNVGEVVSSLVASGSAVSLTTATPANITSISLTAGDWDVQANVNVLGASTTTAAAALQQVGISTTSATLPTDGSQVIVAVPVATTTSFNTGASIPRVRINVSITTTVYLVAEATFTAGTVTAYGGITARRVR